MYYRVSTCTFSWSASPSSSSYSSSSFVIKAPRSPPCFNGWSINAGKSRRTPNNAGHQQTSRGSAYVALQERREERRRTRPCRSTVMLTPEGSSFVSELLVRNPVSYSGKSPQDSENNLGVALGFVGLH